VPTECAHGRVCNRRKLAVDVHLEDEPIGAKEQQRVDLPRCELLTSGGCRAEHA
jgi:hypothetical protein